MVRLVRMDRLVWLERTVGNIRSERNQRTVRLVRLERMDWVVRLERSVRNERTIWYFRSVRLERTLWMDWMVRSEWSVRMVRMERARRCSESTWSAYEHCLNILFVPLR